MATINPECLTNVIRLQEMLEISSTFPTGDSNTYINLINSCSRAIRRLCKRSYFKYKTLTEYYDGKGIEKLLLKHWPVISVTSLYDDANRSYGSNSLIAAADYEIINSDGNSGIIRIFDGTFGNNQSNVKITYVAGWSEFIIEPSLNTIEFNEGASDLTATLSTAIYNASSLATEMKTQLDSAGTLTYTVTYSEVSHKFTIAGTGAFSILWNTGASTTSEFGKLIGFDDAADDSSSTSHTSDEPVLGIPDDLISGCEEWVRWLYASVKENRAGKFTESRGEQSFSFDYTNLPEHIKRMVYPYRAWRMY